MAVKVSDRIGTFSESDVYATGDANRQALGFHAVESLDERNQIPYDRRRGTYQNDGDDPKPFFVAVRIADEVKLYWLKNEPGEGNTENSDWEEFISGYEEPFQGFFIPASATMVNGTGIKGQYWIASTAGTFNGESYLQYDKAIYDGSVWKRTGAGSVVSDWTTMINKPTQFTPIVHTHTISEVSGLQVALDNKFSVEGVQQSLDFNSTTKVPTSKAVADYTYSQEEINTRLSNLSTYGIKYAWLNSTGMSTQTGQLNGDLGLREDEQKVYKWSGTAWVYFFTVASNIPLATPTNDGLMSKEDKASLGTNNTRSNTNAFTLGDSNEASGINSTAMGNGSIASNSNTVSSGHYCQATSNSAHAFGFLAKATGLYSHASNLNTNATGRASHAEGWLTTASGDLGAHSEGDTTVASGSGSHSQNSGTRAIGNSSHAGGIRARAVGLGSFNHSTHYTQDPTVNTGAVGENSAVLGGLNNGTSETAINSATIGGEGLINTEPNSVLVPKLIVDSGIIVNSAGTNLLVGSGGSEIDDSTISNMSTWSSDKINDVISAIPPGVQIDDSSIDYDKTWSAEKIDAKFDDVHVEISQVENLVYDTMYTLDEHINGVNYTKLNNSVVTDNSVHDWLFYGVEASDITVEMSISYTTRAKQLLFVQGNSGKIIFTQGTGVTLRSKSGIFSTTGIGSAVLAVETQNLAGAVFWTLIHLGGSGTNFKTGTVVDFVSPETHFGTEATPETGNITLNLTGASVGHMAFMTHNSGTEPTFASGLHKIAGSGNYVLGVNNYITFDYRSAGRINYSITQ